MKAGGMIRRVRLLSESVGYRIEVKDTSSGNLVEEQEMCLSRFIGVRTKGSVFAAWDLDCLSAN
jgi:hypothetical protein